MYGGSGKLGRGGGAGKRNIYSSFAAPPLHRLSSAAAPGGPLSMGGGGAAPRNRTVSASVPVSCSSEAAEETFSLVTGNPLNFAVIIRLAPDLVEQIKRVEAQGGMARIKFDANANNPAGNVISVGDKDFRFTWSPETGDLCDIYEECRSGEDGNGLLVESGCAWRKLNVQRVLDESTKNHVKMLSEEAERKLKSRKSIVLDHGTPSMPSFVAAESNPWRMPFKQTKEQPPFKKRKAEPSSGGPPISVQKSGLTTAIPSKGRPQASPPSSRPDLPVAPFGIGNISKGRANVGDTIHSQAMNKTASSEKDTAGRVISSAVQEKPGGKGFKRAQPTDLRSMLISLLVESPSKGMSLKALEKAIGDTIPNSVKQIEPILKKIATFQAPGRYFLKPGVEIESYKKPLSESQSSPEDNRHLLPNHEKYDQQPVQQSSSVMRADNKELEDQVQLNLKSEEAPKSLEKVNFLHNSADLFGEKKISDNNEGPVNSSGDSGSDSDSESDSADSGSDNGSHSRSRSRSPAGSGSGSSSDGESDASTNSKEASDVDVDIMTSDDDKEAKHRFQATGLGSPKSPVLWRSIDGESGHIGIDEKQDGHVSDTVEGMPEDEHVSKVAALSDSVPNKEGERHVEETEPSSHTYHEHQERHDYLGKVNSETDSLSEDVFKHEQSDSSEKAPRGKHKRASDDKHSQDKPDRAKRLKTGNLNQLQISGSRTATIVESHQNSSPDIPFEDLHKGPNLQMTNRMVRDINTGFGPQRGYKYNHAISGKPKTDSLQSSRSADPHARAKTTPTTERQGKHTDNASCSVRQPERSLNMTGGFPLQKDKFNRETQDDYRITNHKGPAKFSKEDFEEKHKNPVNSHYRKHESLGNFKEFGSVSNSQVGNSPKDDSMNISNRSIENGRAKVLQRELSDLELGELRQSLPEEALGFAKQIERRSSFKKLDNKPLSSENLDSDSSKGKPPGKIVAETSKPSLLNSNIPVSGNPECISKRGISEHYAEDLSRPHQKFAQSQHWQHQSRVNHNDSGTQYNRVVEPSGRSRAGDTGRNLETAPEVHGNPQNKISANALQEHEAKRGVVPPSRKESKRQKSKSIPNLNDKQKDASLTGSSDGGQKRRESPDDENSCPYSKYDKKEPELKGKIKDFSQFKDYLGEFQEKQEPYLSINNILKSYREVFLKYTREYEAASNGRDAKRYKDVVRLITKSYCQNIERHQRLKRIFCLLHEELRNLKQMIGDFAEPYLRDMKDE